MSDEFEVKVELRKSSVLSPSLFADVIDDVTDLVKDVSRELLYPDDSVTVSEANEGC